MPQRKEGKLPAKNGAEQPQAKETLSKFLKSKDKDEKQILLAEFLTILPKLNDYLRETLLYKIDEELVGIAKLTKQLLRELDSVFPSLDKDKQKNLLEFVHLSLKRTAKQTQFQTDVANYFKRKFINLGDCVLIEKEGIVFQKNTDGTYSTIPVGTADLVITIVDKGKIIAQYCIECDGASHVDQKKDEQRNQLLTKNSDKFLCLKHGDLNFEQYLSQYEDKKEVIDEIVQAINCNQAVVNAKESLIEKILKYQEIKLPRQGSFFRALFDDVDCAEDEAPECLSDPGKPFQSKPQQQRGKKSDRAFPAKTLDKEALEEAIELAERERKLINQFLQPIQQEEWDKFLEQTSEICKKSKQSRSQLDNYLLSLAKTYVAELLKTNYPGLFQWKDILKQLKPFDVSFDEMLSIANYVLENEKLEEKELAELMKEAFGDKAKVFNSNVDCDRSLAVKICCYYRYPCLFNLFIKGEDVDLVDNEKGFTALMLAAQEGHTEIVELLLKNKANVDLANNERSTALMFATQNGHKEIVQLLLTKTADVNLKNSQGRTALMIATAKGHKEIVALLLGKDAKVDLANNERFTALMFATQNGHKEIVELLLTKTADVNLKNNQGCTALMIAAFKGHKEIVESLLRKAAKVDLANNERYTALMIAAQNGHTAIVELLLGKKAKVNSANNEKGSTALIIAAQEGHKEIARLLLEKDAKVDLADKYGSTALMIAAFKGHTEIVELLLKNKANVDLANNEHFTALMIAAQEGHKEIVKLLLEKDAKVDLANNERFTALMIAAQNGHTAIVELLLEKDAKVDLADNEGFTALMFAAFKGDKEIAELLLGKDTNKVDLANKCGSTALMIATAKGDKEIVALLLKKDAKVDLADNEGLTALIIATAKGDKEIVELLCEHCEKPPSSTVTSPEASPQTGVASSR